MHNEPFFLAKCVPVSIYIHTLWCFFFSLEEGAEGKALRRVRSYNDHKALINRIRWNHCNSTCVFFVCIFCVFCMCFCAVFVCFVCVFVRFLYVLYVFCVHFLCIFVCVFVRFLYVLYVFLCIFLSILYVFLCGFFF